MEFYLYDFVYNKHFIVLKLKLTVGKKRYDRAKNTKQLQVYNQIV